MMNLKIMRSKIMDHKGFFSCICFCIFFLLILIVLCVLFLVPRAVNFHPGFSGASFDMETPGTFLIKFATDIKVTNKNFFSVTVSSAVNLSAPVCQRTIGGATLMETYLPPRSITNGKLSGTIKYSAMNDSGYCVLKEMADGCSYGNLTVTAIGDVKYSTWIKSGSMSMTKELPVDCRALLLPDAHTSI